MIIVIGEEKQKEEIERNREKINGMRDEQDDQRNILRTKRDQTVMFQYLYFQFKQK